MKFCQSYLLLCFLIQGCATRFEVKVDSIKNEALTTGKKYIIESGNEKVTAITDLQFQEFAKYVDVALQKNGFQKAEGPSEADIAIFMLYGIGDPERVYYSYSMPVYGQTSGGSSSYSQTTFSPSGRYSTTFGSVESKPQYGIVGSQSVMDSDVLYFRYLILDAVDLKTHKTTQKILPAWKTTVTSSGSSDDLRLVIPYMIIASEPYIGVNTGTKVRVFLYEDNPDVQKLLGKKIEKIEPIRRR